MIAVVCWQNVPFYMILFLAGLASFSPELQAAAKLDGWRATGRSSGALKLPHLQGTIRTGAMLAVIGSLRLLRPHLRDDRRVAPTAPRK